MPAGQSHLMSWILHLLGSNHFATTVPRATEPGFSLFFANPLFNLRSHGQIVNNFRPLRSLTLTAGVGCVSAAPRFCRLCRHGIYGVLPSALGCPLASGRRRALGATRQCQRTTSRRVTRARTTVLYYLYYFSRPYVKSSATIKRNTGRMLTLETFRAVPSGFAHRPFGVSILYLHT